MVARSRRSCRALAVTIVSVSIFAAGWTGVAGRETEPPRLTFGSLLDPTEGGATEQLLAQIRSEIEELIRRDYAVRFPAAKQLTSDWTVEGIRRDLDTLLADPEVDVVLVVGPYSTAALCCYAELPKPVFAPLGVDGDALGLPSHGDTSGVRNLNYLSNPGASFRDLEMFREIVGFEVVHVLGDPLIYQVLEGLYERNQRLAEALGIRVEVVFGTSSAAQALQSLPANTQAVYITPLLRMSAREMQKLIDGLNRRKIPTMSLFGRPEVEMGVLAGLRAPQEFPRMARRIALNVQRALFGDDPGTFSITFERNDRLVINMDTAREIDLYPTWDVLTDAELLHEEIPTANRLTLSAAVLDALEANREILSAQREVAAGVQSIRQVRAGYRPQLDASAGADRINVERAVFRAEALSTVGARLSQVIWSDPRATAIRVERDFQRGREQGLVRTELDIAAQAASAFLEVLRSRTLERIERDNLRRVEANLELARNRVKVGSAGPAEVYRWEVERANGKNSVIFAGRLVDIRKTQMNQLMYQPQEKPFVADEPDIHGDPYLAVGNEEVASFYDNPWSFRIFRNFVVEDGLRNSPELQQLDAAVRAQERLFGEAKRSFWSPTIGFRGEYDRVIQQDAEQSSAGFRFPDAEWAVGLSVALPLYVGGERSAVKRRRYEQLLGLRADRENLSDKVELRIRTSMFRIAASWSNIELSREAAGASLENLDLVTDSYATGVVSIQDLLDAQNSALIAELQASNAVYDFLLDLIEVQRAAGRLDWFKSEEDRDAWVRRIRQYFDEVRESGESPGGFE